MAPTRSAPAVVDRPVENPPQIESYESASTTSEDDAPAPKPRRRRRARFESSEIAEVVNGEGSDSSSGNE